MLRLFPIAECSHFCSAGVQPPSVGNSRRRDPPSVGSSRRHVLADVIPRPLGVAICAATDCE